MLFRSHPSLGAARVAVLAVSMATIGAFYRVARLLDSSSAGLRVLQFVFLPILFPQFFLAYTDVTGLLFVVLMVWAALGRRYGVAGLCGLLAWLVRQQHFHGRVRRRVAQGLGRIALVRGIEQVGGVVSHPGQHQGLPLAFKHDVFIEKHGHVQPAQLVDPGMGAGVVLVVAGDEEHAVLRAHPAERRDVRRELGHAAVDEVARDGDRSEEHTSELQSH